MRRRTFVASLAVLAIGATTVAPALAADSLGIPGGADPTVPAARDAEPVVLTGASFPQWAAPAELTAKVPSVAGASCTSGDNTCTHNQYETPELATGDKLGHGADVTKLLGYRWNGKKFEQIPFQVDELATRYISNNASTFSVYSQTDQHPTYVFDQERFRWTKSDPADPCKAVANGPATTPDPVPGLDTNDELAFMASDAGGEAPANEKLPRGVTGAAKVVVADPLAPAKVSYVYVMLAGTDNHAPTPAFNTANGYVRYLPDADSDTFTYSQSSYGSYGNAEKGPYFDPATNTCVTDPNRFKQHRPKDTAWIKTPRYQFRYDGRWLMTAVHVASPSEDQSNKMQRDASTWTYGPDLVDQWKARAFQQRPGGTTPCCGYEEEVNNWGGSSILMGWRAGPVRAIRATWGADSSTNNVRTDYFYRDQVRINDDLRVHVVPPGDGIYTQWDFNAGKVDKYYNAFVPKGVAADGKNDEVFGNAFVHSGPDGFHLKDGDQVPVIGPVDVGTPGAHVGEGNCGNTPLEKSCIDNDVDLPDPTFSGPLGTLSYEEVSGPHGTWVDRWAVKQVTAGTAYGLVTAPYYRDDSCFDDGTGTDPGLHVNRRSTDPSVDSTGAPRACWRPTDGDPAATQPRDHFWQGDIATHGLHIELIADSDNAFTTVPLTEIDAEQQITLVPGEHGNLGEQYGRATEKPLVTTVLPVT
jgi:hypothetical protein